MKITPLVLMVASASALAIWPRQFGGRGRFGGGFNGVDEAFNPPTRDFDRPPFDGDAAQDNITGDEATDDGASDDAPAAAPSNGDTAGATLVLTEQGGIPGNECLTFRNNGEIVDAACVTEAIDRQLTPTTINGQSVLRVQRTFTAGFRPDLADVAAACVGFNGTHFRAEDCDATGIEFVTFSNGQLTAQRGACASGHDDAAQMTVDETGSECATYTSTSVEPAAA